MKLRSTFARGSRGSRRSAPTCPAARPRPLTKPKRSGDSASASPAASLPRRRPLSPAPAWCTSRSDMTTRALLLSLPSASPPRRRLRDARRRGRPRGPAVAVRGRPLGPSTRRPSSTSSTTRAPTPTCSITRSASIRGAAQAIVAARDGHDGVSPSADDAPFADITADRRAVPYVGDAAFAKLQAYATAHPAPKGETVEGGPRRVGSRRPSLRRGRPRATSPISTPSSTTGRRAPSSLTARTRPSPRWGRSRTSAGGLTGRSVGTSARRGGPRCDPSRRASRGTFDGVDVRRCRWRRSRWPSPTRPRSPSSCLHGSHHGARRTLIVGARPFTSRLRASRP